jgi:flagellar biosynthesis/type III secretory pathway protein FliH
MKIQIVNPLYDAAFKYLMDDNNIAKLILSTIIGEKIIHLKAKPQEQVSISSIQEQIEKVKNKDKVTLEFGFSIYHLDFIATVKYDDGTEKVILLELQKANLSTNIFRFREYLGNQLANPNNINWVETSKGKIIAKNAIPIQPIYLLGYPFSVIKDVSVVKVLRQYIDASTGTVLKCLEPFIEGLSYDSIFISVSDLDNKLRTDLEKMLNIFNQKFVMSNRQLIEIDEKSVPDIYRPILIRLKNATKSKEVRETMRYEDLLLNEIEHLQDLAWEKGIEQGIEQGIEKGMEKGKKALEEARINTIKIAQEFVGQGVSKSLVANINNISETELDEWLLMKFK